MKKSMIIILVFIIMQVINLMAIQSEMIIIDPLNKKEIVMTEEEVVSENINEHIEIINKNSRNGLIWEATAPWAICKSVGISDDTYCPFIGWHSNDEAYSYFGATDNNPIWEYDIEGAEFLAHDITSDGTYMVGTAGNTIYGFSASSGIPDWTYTISNPDDDIFQIVISNDSSTIYFVSGDDYDYSFITSVDINTSTENWSYSLPSGGYSARLVLSRNNEKLLITQYYDAIIYSNTGELIIQTSIAGGSQCTPVISDDGNIFALGSLSGCGTVYEYTALSQAYNLKWQYQFGGRDYVWVNAVSISGEGNTIAFGSLQNENDINSGELAVFNIESNEPLWIYQSENDLISDIDISMDGSVIAVSSWGPEDDNDDDFWFFNIDSSEPIFSYNCQGSPMAIDLSNDGSRCIVGGKAVHCRTMGHGGKLYYFDNSPVSGVVTGIVTNTETGNPLEDALITIGFYSTTSNANGEYLIEQINHGDYLLNCELTGYDAYSEEITVDEAIEFIDICLHETVATDNIEIQISNYNLSNYPNPFNPSTTISFQFTSEQNRQDEQILLEIYNLKGQIIRQYSILKNQFVTEHKYSIVWNGKNEKNNLVSSGIYFYKLNFGKFTSSINKMILIK